MDRRRSIRRALAGVALFGTLLMNPSPAEASNFGPGGGIYYADDTFHEIGLTSTLTFSGDHYSRTAMDEIDTTDVYAYGPCYYPSCSMAAVDVAAAEEYVYGETWAGKVECTYVVPYTNNCDHWYLRYNRVYSDGYDSVQWQALACHEFGHTIGLRHSDEVYGTSCMYYAIGATPSRHFSGHDRIWVNGYY